MNKQQKIEQVIAFVVAAHVKNGKSQQYAMAEGDLLRESGIRRVSDDTCYILGTDEFRKRFISWMNWFK